jgi:hypothetical protein
MTSVRAHGTGDFAESVISPVRGRPLAPTVSVVADRTT